MRKDDVYKVPGPPEAQRGSGGSDRQFRGPLSLPRHVGRGEPSAEPAAYRTVPRGPWAANMLTSIVWSGGAATLAHVFPVGVSEALWDGMRGSSGSCIKYVALGAAKAAAAADYVVELLPSCSKLLFFAHHMSLLNAVESAVPAHGFQTHPPSPCLTYLAPTAGGCRALPRCRSM